MTAATFLGMEQFNRRNPHLFIVLARGQCMLAWNCPAKTVARVSPPTARASCHLRNYA